MFWKLILWSLCTILTDYLLLRNLNNNKTIWTMYQEMRTKDDAWMQPFTRVSTSYRRLLIVCPKMGQPYKTMMSICATRRWHICLKWAEGHWANTEAMAHCLTMSSVEKFCTSVVRLSRLWNGSTTASTWWITADKFLLYFWREWNLPLAQYSSIAK